MGIKKNNMVKIGQLNNKLLVILVVEAFATQDVKPLNFLQTKMRTTDKKNDLTKN